MPPPARCSGKQLKVAGGTRSFIEAEEKAVVYFFGFWSYKSMYRAVPVACFDSIQAIHVIITVPLESLYCAKGRGKTLDSIQPNSGCVDDALMMH